MLSGHDLGERVAVSMTASLPPELVAPVFGDNGLCAMDEMDLPELRNALAHKETEAADRYLGPITS